LRNGRKPGHLLAASDDSPGLRIFRASPCAGFPCHPCPGVPGAGARDQFD